MTAIELLRNKVKNQIDHADKKSLKMVIALLLSEHEYDWWDKLSENAKASIEQGLKDAEEGRITPHKEVMEKYKILL